MAQTGLYYDGVKLLSLKDCDGLTPAVYVSETNRSGGKTTYFSRYLINRFLKHNEQFILLYRMENELKDVHVKFFEDELQELFFPDHEMTSSYHKGDGFCTLMLDGVECGFGVALSAANKIKKISKHFIHVETIFFDEMQLEDMDYDKDEITHFLSIYKSVARGGGKAARYVRVIMACNPVSILNPYYTELGVTTKINQNGDFCKGPGWVVETSVCLNAQEQQQRSAISRAFGNSDYIKFSDDGVHMINDSAFIAKPSGRNNYLLTLRYNGKDYSIRQYFDAGVIFVSDNVDATFPIKIACTKDDHTINYVMDNCSKTFIPHFREMFARGVFRFADINSKNALLTFIAMR